MANTVKFLDDRFIAISGIGMAQTDMATPLADEDIDTRLKCTIALEDNVEREIIRDCEDVDRTNEKTRTRYRRLRLTFTSVTAQLKALFFAYYIGTASAPTGTAQNEIQTLTRDGVVTGGTFTLALTLEGRTATTKPIAYNATASDIADALTAARMKWIQPGDVSVSGDWGTAVAVTFQNRLGNANLPLMVVDNTLITGGGSILIAETQAGSNFYHEFTRSTSRQKIHTSFALGYKDGVTDPQKFSGFVVETFTPSANRRQNAGLEVTLVGPYEPETMTGYVIPECENPDPMQSEDCKVLINGSWETTDVSTLTAPLNDNIPLDDSAYGFDGIDPDLLARAKQVDYDVNAQIFAIETDPISVLAENERTQVPVDAKYHFGMPGDRFTLLAPETKVKFAQGEHFVPVGAAERIAGNFQLSAFKDDQDPPIAGEAYVNQATAFLTT